MMAGAQVNRKFARMIDDLEKRGMVVRKQTPDGEVIRITDEGRKYLERIKAAQQAEGGDA